MPAPAFTKTATIKYLNNDTGLGEHIQTVRIYVEIL